MPIELMPDSNAVIAYFAGDLAATARFESATEIFACVVVCGELYYGASYSVKVESNTALVDGFAADNSVLKCDLETARRFGAVKAELRRRGRMIPDNDIWIAAIALEYDLTLMTNDAHFSEVEGLKTVGW